MFESVSVERSVSEIGRKTELHTIWNIGGNSMSWSNWAYYSDGDIQLDYKYKSQGDSYSVIIREAGQSGEYPHFTVDFDSNGNILDFHNSAGRFGERFGRREVMAALVTGLLGMIE